MNTRTFLVYAIVVSLLEQAALLAVMLVALPAVGLVLPTWLVWSAVAVMAGTSVVLTWMNLKAIGLKPVRSPDVGCRARVVRTLAPRGYVRVGNELWPAVCECGTVESGADVTVVRMEGLRLIVEPVTEARDAGEQSGACRRTGT